MRHCIVGWVLLRAKCWSKRWVWILPVPSTRMLSKFATSPEYHRGEKPTTSPRKGHELFVSLGSRPSSETQLAPNQTLRFLELKVGCRSNCCRYGHHGHLWNGFLNASLVALPFRLSSNIWTLQHRTHAVRGAFLVVTAILFSLTSDHPMDQLVLPFGKCRWWSSASSNIIQWLKKPAAVANIEQLQIGELKCFKFSLVLLFF